jgi:hypothetical protein
MHRIDLGRLGSTQHGIDIQVGFLGCGRSDLKRFVGEFHGQRIRIGKAVDLHGADTQSLGRTNDAHGNLATVGDEKRADRHASTSAST